MTTDLTELTGAYAAPWLPWIMIPLVFYILPFPVFAIVFLWIEREGDLANANASTANAPSMSGGSSMTSFASSSSGSEVAPSPTPPRNHQPQQPSSDQHEAQTSTDDQSHEAS